MQTATTDYTPPNDHYTDFLGSIHRKFSSATGLVGHLFTTDADPEELYQMYLTCLPESEQQPHACHACRHFIQRYGGLVTITENGRTVPVMWGNIPGLYGDALSSLSKRVSRARVTGVFLSSTPMLGTPVTGPWRHMSVTLPPEMLWRKSRIQTEEQASAEKKQEYAMLQRGLAEFGIDVVEKALTILDSEVLYRSEKCLGPAKFLHTLHKTRAAVKGKNSRENVTWLAVATAPVGWAHVRSSMIGTLLDDLSAGMGVPEVKRRFAEKMNPLRYMRPQAEPKDGNIAQAEKIVAELQSAGSLERRFARLEDIQTLWTPSATVEVPGDGVFGHLKAKKLDAITALPPVTMTWDKFSKKVLPEAEKIEFLVPSYGAFLAMCTAVHADSPSILQWDSEDKRNQVSWYVYPGGSPAEKWNLRSSAWAPVTAIAELPFMWDKTKCFPHHGEGIVLVLEGCRDLVPTGGAAIFPETLRSEYHGIRRTLEAYSRKAEIADKQQASACGLDLRKGKAWRCEVRVTSHEGKKIARYVLDRWD